MKILFTTLVVFGAAYYDEGVIKYNEGEFYPLTSETQSLVNSGHAELVSDERTLPALVALSRIATARATEARAYARQLDNEAKDATAAVAEVQRLADDRAAQEKATADDAAKAAAEAEALRLATESTGSGSL